MKQSPIPKISVELQKIVQHIVDDVVAKIGCVGAMISTLEQGNALPPRAYSVSFPISIVSTIEQILNAQLISTNSTVYLDGHRSQNNLGVRAIKQIRETAVPYLKSTELHDLFRPIISRNKSIQAQTMLQIKEIIALPFLLNKEVVGVLFAAHNEPFSEHHIAILSAFSHQATTAMQHARYNKTMAAINEGILTLQSDLTQQSALLQTIVDVVVHRLGYAGAMVATLESGNSLPVRAYAVDFAQTLLHQLEKQMGISILSDRAVVYLDQPKYQTNLSVRAILGEKGKPSSYLLSDSLYDLFRPIVNRPLSDAAQKMIGIKQVIAIPFSLDKDIIGNLFVASRKERFTSEEITVLLTFSQQAAVGIRNAQLFQTAEEQRKIAQMFARMAFSATAYIHKLRNYVGAFQANIQLLELFPHLPSEKQLEIIQASADLKPLLNKAAEILDHLHEPWTETEETEVNINNCLVWAIRDIFPNIEFIPGTNFVDTGEKIGIFFDLDPKIPAVFTSKDMLVEAFRVILKNGVEAIQEHLPEGFLWLSTKSLAEGIEISIRDNGTGIPISKLARIFDMGWSTKNGRGMGFGLFWTKDYIEGLEGTISVQSVTNEGTTFTLYFPTLIE